MPTDDQDAPADEPVSGSVPGEPGDAADDHEVQDRSESAGDGVADAAPQHEPTLDEIFDATIEKLDELDGVDEDEHVGAAPEAAGRAPLGGPGRVPDGGSAPEDDFGAVGDSEALRSLWESVGSDRPDLADADPTEVDPTQIDPTQTDPTRADPTRTVPLDTAAAPTARGAGSSPTSRRAAEDALTPELLEHGLTPDDFDDGLWARHPDTPRRSADPDSWAEFAGLRREGDEYVVDQWAWLNDEQQPARPVDLSHCRVTAVLVTFDAERWLTETLAGIATLDRRPDRIIAIDNASIDGTPGMLQRALDRGTLDAVYRGRRRYGFGTAVRQALRADAEAGHPLPGAPVVRAAVAVPAEPTASPASDDDAPPLADAGESPDTEETLDTDAPEPEQEPEHEPEPEPEPEAVPKGEEPDRDGPIVVASRDARGGETTTDAGGAAPEPPPADPDHWLWLLHDDAAPQPGALRALLEHVVTEPEIDVTGPKLLLPGEGRWAAAGPPISEIGVSISGTGRRDLMIDRGEIDQGQRDTARDVLGVSTCGMLVRTTVWHALDGLDPGLPVFRDGVDFGWRCHRQGLRVVTTPQAELTHRQVGRAGLRPRAVGGRRPGRVDRQLGLLVVAGHAPAVLLPLVWLRLIWGCLLRAAGYVVGKVPARALDELLAAAGFAAHPGRIAALRRRVAATPAADGSAAVIRRLRPPWWSSLAIAAEAISGVVSDRYRSVAGDLDAASLDELTGDDFAVVGEEKPRHPWLSPVVVTAALTVIGSIVAARGLFGTGSLASSALLPAPSLTQLWASATQAVPGAPGAAAPPWLALAAVASTVLAGRPEWFVTSTICLVVPLALLSAYPLLRRTVHDRRLRWWAALSYALLPVLLGGTNQGRLALCVVAVLLPQLAVAARAIVLRRVRTPEAWRGGWGAGAALAVLTAFEPVILPVAALLGGIGALVLIRAPRKVGRIGIALGVPVLLWSPWWIALLRSPAGSWGRLLVGPDSALTRPGAAPAGWELLIGRETGAGLPPLLLSVLLAGTIWVAALVAVGRRPANRTVLSGWVCAAVAFAAAIGVSRLVVSLPPAGLESRPWTGSLLLLGFGALLLAGAAGLDGFAAQIRARSFSWLQPAVLLTGVFAALVSLGAAAWWIVAGLSGPIDREPLDAVPPYVRNAMAAPAGVRVLAVELRRNQASYAVLDDDQLRLGDADRGFAFGAAQEPPVQVRLLVLRLVAGTADEAIGAELRSLGIGYLWVRGAGLVDQARIDNTPGLGTPSDVDGVVIWPVEGVTTRAEVVSPDGTALPAVAPGTVLPAGTEGRQLRLAETADPRWWATLDGRDLTPVTLDWQQAFVVGEAAGELRFGLHGAAAWWLVPQGIGLVVVVVLAAPAVRRPELRDPTRAARRAARVVGGPR